MRQSIALLLILGSGAAASAQNQDNGFFKDPEDARRMVKVAKIGDDEFFAPDRDTLLQTARDLAPDVAKLFRDVRSKLKQFAPNFKQPKSLMIRLVPMKGPPASAMYPDLIDWDNDRVGKFSGLLYAAHEFFHLVQYAYLEANLKAHGITPTPSALSCPWMGEATAEYMATRMFPVYQDARVKTLDTGLCTTGLFSYETLDPSETATRRTLLQQYGGFIFFHYLEAYCDVPALILQFYTDFMATRTHSDPEPAWNQDTVLRKALVKKGVTTPLAQIYAQFVIQYHWKKDFEPFKSHFDIEKLGGRGAIQVPGIKVSWDFPRREDDRLIVEGSIPKQAGPGLSIVRAILIRRPEPDAGTLKLNLAVSTARSATADQITMIALAKKGALYGEPATGGVGRPILIPSWEKYEGALVFLVDGSEEGSNEITLSGTFEPAARPAYTGFRCVASRRHEGAPAGVFLRGDGVYFRVEFDAKNAPPGTNAEVTWTIQRPVKPPKTSRPATFEVKEGRTSYTRPEPAKISQDADGGTYSVSAKVVIGGESFEATTPFEVSDEKPDVDGLDLSDTIDGPARSRFAPGEEIWARARYTLPGPADGEQIVRIVWSRDGEPVGDSNVALPPGRHTAVFDFPNPKGSGSFGDHTVEVSIRAGGQEPVTLSCGYALVRPLEWSAPALVATADKESTDAVRDFRPGDAVFLVLRYRVGIERAMNVKFEISTTGPDGAVGALSGHDEHAAKEGDRWASTSGRIAESMRSGTYTAVGRVRLGDEAIETRTSFRVSRPVRITNFSVTAGKNSNVVKTRFERGENVGVYLGYSVGEEVREDEKLDIRIALYAGNGTKDQWPMRWGPSEPQTGNWYVRHGGHWGANQPPGRYRFVATVSVGSYTTQAEKWVAIEETEEPPPEERPDPTERRDEEPPRRTEEPRTRPLAWVYVGSKLMQENIDNFNRINSKGEILGYNMTGTTSQVVVRIALRGDSLTGSATYDLTGKCPPTRPGDWFNWKLSASATSGKDVGDIGDSHLEGDFELWVGGSRDNGGITVGVGHGSRTHDSKTIVVAAPKNGRVGDRAKLHWFVKRVLICTYEWELQEK